MTDTNNSNVTQESTLNSTHTLYEVPPRRRDSGIVEEPMTRDQVVELLQYAGTQAVIEELTTMRTEIEEIKRGGWRVAVGPFQQVMDPTTQDEYERIRQEIATRLEGKAEEAVRALLAEKGSSQAVV
jgi:hypothetical protein